MELYDMTITHHPGQMHQNVDALSRLPACEQCDVKHEFPKTRRNVKILQTMASPTNVPTESFTIDKSWIFDNDKELSNVIKLLKQGRILETHPVEISSNNEDFWWRN
jgi:hydrogenase maturation factor HypF (carbamoyltransferase family)